jgi:hypothetical protein
MSMERRFFETPREEPWTSLTSAGDGTDFDAPSAREGVTEEGTSPDSRDVDDG